MSFLTKKMLRFVLKMYLYISKPIQRTQKKKKISVLVCRIVYKYLLEKKNVEANG